jgi:hypothetical protein
MCHLEPPSFIGTSCSKLDGRHGAERKPAVSAIAAGRETRFLEIHFIARNESFANFAFAAIADVG